ncbi:hypothetical protein [Apilactobacillus kunkeei]|uniref:hypothetical protein n=1 Tax=Apilactobacillus kunkeei TaxID=148814 RepID=UPI0012D72F0C|nr:hypothetical protein [Apilactobacillus kunkeei]
MKELFIALSLFIFASVTLVAHAASSRVTTTDDVSSVWVNHRDKDIHQKITFTKNHHG